MRLPTFYNKEKATLCRQLQNVKQGRDAAYANVTALKKEKRDLEDKLRKRDCMVEESARLRKQEIMNSIRMIRVRKIPLKSCSGRLRIITIEELFVQFNTMISNKLKCLLSNDNHHALILSEQKRFMMIMTSKLYST